MSSLIPATPILQVYVELRPGFTSVIRLVSGAFANSLSKHHSIV